MNMKPDLQLRIDDSALHQAQAKICTAVRAAGGRAVLVGGCVRDFALGITAKDLDIEVYGLAPAALKAILAPLYALDLVGAAFGVLKLRGLAVDVSIPRRESKTGLGHKAFEILSTPDLPMPQAAARRDFTINAMSLDPLTGEVFDFFNGLQDLRDRVLRHTSAQFSEDPLRVLRGMQFAARLQLQPAEETIALCRLMQPEGLAPERILEEWRKLLLLGIEPSRGLEFLRLTDWIRHYPELAALIGCEQDAAWHPEGDAWQHTLHSLDAFAQRRTGDPQEDLVVGLAVLCHDLGKPATTRMEENGRIRSRGHDVAGEAPTRAFLSRMTRQQDLIEEVIPLVTQHMRVQEYHVNRAGDATIRRLAQRVGRIDRLVRVDLADRNGRGETPEPDADAAGQWILERARALEVERSAPEPIIKGRHLLTLGMHPGPKMSPILKACYEAQLEGTVANLEDGLTLARHLIRDTEPQQP